MIIAVTNHKGGTGKTTTALNLGAALAAKKKKVLLVDLDPQGNLTYSLGITAVDRDICRLFTEELNFEDVICQVEGMDVLPATMDLADIELTLQSVPNRTHILKLMLEERCKNYDVVIIDCPPSRSLLTINALCFADCVLVAILLDVLSIQGLMHIMKTIQDVQDAFNEKLTLLGVLPVMVDCRMKLPMEVRDLIAENKEIPLLKTMIRNNVKIAEAPSHAMSVLKYAPNSPGAKDYESLAKEIMNKKVWL
jgi:chromosome partitioning protein